MNILFLVKFGKQANLIIYKEPDKQIQEVACGLRTLATLALTRRLFLVLGKLITLNNNPILR